MGTAYFMVKKSKTVMLCIRNTFINYVDYHPLKYRKNSLHSVNGYILQYKHVGHKILHYCIFNQVYVCVDCGSHCN